MSLIPFILDLADELQDFQRCLISGCNAMDVDDIDFGLYPLQESAVQQHQQQQQQQQQNQQQQQQQQPQPQLQQLQQQQHQLEQQQHRRPRLLSQLFFQPNILQKHQHHHRHHPYHHDRFCCSMKEKEANAIGEKLSAANTLVGLANKRAAYPLVKKNGWVMVSMNVKQFTPDELTVKTVDNCIIIEGRHEDKEDIHGVISRHFIRKYLLPKGYDPNDVVSTLSSDGILTVKAPPPKLQNEGTIRIVDIQQTGPTHSSAKDMRATADSENSNCSSSSSSNGNSNRNSNTNTTVITTTITMEQPKTSIDTSLEKDKLIEMQTMKESDQKEKEKQQQQQKPSSSSSSALEVENEGIDSVEDVSLLEQVEQETLKKEKDESIGCAGVNTTAATTTTTTTTITTAPAVEILAESANPIAAPTEETESVSPVDATIGVDIPIATEMDATTEDDIEMTVNNKAKIEADDIERKTDVDAIDDGNFVGSINDDGNGDGNVDELTYEVNEKNGDMTTETTGVLSSNVDVDVAVPCGKDACVSKGVVIEAASSATITNISNTDNENDNDNEMDTNGRPGIVETLANTTEELVAN